MLNMDVRRRSKLHIDVRRRGDVMVLDLAGKLHLGNPAEQLRDKVNSLLHQGYRKCVINLERVKTMDTEGFGALLTARREVTKTHGQIALVNVTRRLKDVIVISGLLTHFRIFDSEAEALAALAPDWPGDSADPNSVDEGTRVFGTA